MFPHRNKFTGKVKWSIYSSYIRSTFLKILNTGMNVSFSPAKRSKKEKKVIPRGAMGEQFEEDGTVQAREQLNSRQGINLKLK